MTGMQSRGVPGEKPGAPRQWLVVELRADRAQAELAAAELLGLGASAVQEVADGLLTYFPEPADPADFVRRLADQTGLHENAIVWRREEEEDWAENWRRGLKPRRVGRRLVITPSWITPETRQDDVVITIDPEMAFGTGEHATTRSSLRLTEAAVHGGERVLDVGTGSGILAIAAALLGAQSVLAVEADADALINAADNVARNAPDAAIELVHAMADAAYLEQERGDGFDVILANVLSGVLLPLLPAFYEALKPGGRLVLSGILESEGDDMLAAATSAGFELSREELEDEWWSAMFVRSANRA